VDYRYNPQGIRFIAVDWNDANLDGTFAVGERTGSVEYLIDNSNFTGYQQTILETVKNATGQATKRITYTFGLDEITQTVSELDPTSQLITQSSTLTYGHDGKGSVRVLFEASAAIAQVFTYSAYGELLAIHNSSGTLQPLGSSLTSVLYNGEGYDTRTGLYNMRARWYSPTNARWERLDPFAGNPNDPFSFHKYGFVHGEPVLSKDPSGKYLIAIDGTGQKNWLTNARNPQKLPNGRWLSHVKNFAQEYEHNGGKVDYDYGPTDGKFASDMPAIEQRVYENLMRFRRQSSANRDEPVDLIGWSRGAYAVLRIAQKLSRGSANPDGTWNSDPIPVRFLGLYDPVDMTFYDDGAYLGRGSNNEVTFNVENVVWAYGHEELGFNSWADGGNVDYDSGSWFWLNWPRMKLLWTKDATQMFKLPIEATHGAIGGTPGYSPDTSLQDYSWKDDIERSIQVDTLMRSTAASVGITIRTLSPQEYGFPARQSQMPQPRQRTWVEWGASWAPRFSICVGIGISF
jgi:RHS repeat-associated protein